MLILKWSKQFISDNLQYLLIIFSIRMEYVTCIKNYVFKVYLKSRTSLVLIGIKNMFSKLSRSKIL